VRTDLVEGFRLDRGFQVMLTAYPEAKRLADYDALQLKKFEPGALVWHGGKFHRFADPFRNPMGAARFLFDSYRAPGGQTARGEAARAGAARHVGRDLCPAGENHARLSAGISVQPRRSSSGSLSPSLPASFWSASW
jgi:hypothetical protein